MLFPFFLWLLKSLQHPNVEGVIPISPVKKMSLREFKWLVQSYRTRFCVGFYPKSCSTHAVLTAPDSIILTRQVSACCGVTEVVHAHCLHCSHTLCPGCVDLSPSSYQEEMGTSEKQVPSLPRLRTEVVQAICASFPWISIWDQDG